MGIMICNKMLKAFCVLCIIILYVVPVYSQTNEQINRHVIIAFDNALPSVYRHTLINDDKVSSVLNKALVNGVNNESILQDGDCYSIVNFVIGDRNNSIDSFVRPSLGADGELVWRDYISIDKVLRGHGRWDDNVFFQGIKRVNGEPFSLLTGAKAYCLKSLYGKKQSKYANKTYLLMVTDDQYNGNNDINTEFNKMRNPYLNKEVFQGNCHLVSQYFNFEFVKDYIIDESLTAPYKVFVYEVVPSSSFALGTVVEYPASLGLERVRGGYRLNFNFRSINTHYIIEKFMVSVNNIDGTETKCEYYKDGEVNLILKSSELPSDSVDVTLRGWLFQNDSVYNGVVMNPYDVRFSRLKVCQRLSLNDNEKIFGILPLYDCIWWWFQNDLKSAVIVWDVILLLLFVILICFIAYKVFNKITAYKPSNDKIKIQQINGNTSRYKKH